MTDLREQRLGAFLRAHRERLRADSGGRRRTPGLRREEVAALAGISTTWLTRLEQGREVYPSAHALARLASALRLSRAERAHLFELGGRHDPEPSRPQGDDLPDSLRRSVEEVACPAYVLDAAWTARAWNGPAVDLFSGWLGGPEHNLLRYVFLDTEARDFIVDWEGRARRLVAEFRIDHERRLQRPDVVTLAEALLAASPLFREAWTEQHVMERAGGPRSFDHPRQGRLDYEQLTLIPAAEPDLKLVMLLPRP